MNIKKYYLRDLLVTSGDNHELLRLKVPNWNEIYKVMNITEYDLLIGLVN